MTNTPYTVVLGEDKIALFQFHDCITRGFLSCLSATLPPCGGLRSLGGADTNIGQSW